MKKINFKFGDVVLTKEQMKRVNGGNRVAGCSAKCENGTTISVSDCTVCSATDTHQGGDGSVNCDGKITSC